MSHSPEQQKLEEAEREMEEADKASAELRLHMERAKELVKSARQTMVAAEQRTLPKSLKG